MSDGSFTLLELHLGDGPVQIGPKTLRGSEPADDDAGDDDVGLPTGLRSVAALALIFGLALAVRRLLSEDLEAAEELDQLA